MVRLTGPGLAQKASGSIAGSVIFSSAKGRPYLKLHRNPKQPRSYAQVAIRAMMAFLSSQWAALSAAEKSTWQELADQRNIPPINAYQAHNLDRWRRYLGPTQAYPATEIGTDASLYYITTTGKPLSVEVEYKIGTLNQTWAMLISHSATAPPVPNWDNLRHAHANPAPAIYKFTLRPFTPGMHWFAFQQTLTTGKIDPSIQWRSACVTD